jgi:hypothetical protein
MNGPFRPSNRSHSDLEVSRRTNSVRPSGSDAQPKAETAANYETAGYVIAGRAELHIEGHIVDLEPGAYSFGGHHPARGSARPGQKRANRLNRDLDDVKEVYLFGLAAQRTANRANPA